jgi:hypothetical protein
MPRETAAVRALRHRAQSQRRDHRSLGCFAAYAWRVARRALLR